jgi:hypothetical protein
MGQIESPGCRFLPPSARRTLHSHGGISFLGFPGPLGPRVCEKKNLSSCVRRYAWLSLHESPCGH